MSTPQPAPRFPMAPYWIVLVIICLFAMAPVFTWIAGLFMAANCDVNLSVATTCPDGSVVNGPLAAGLAFSFVYVLFTWSIGFVAFVIWVIVLLIHQSRWRKRVVGPISGRP